MDRRKADEWFKQGILGHTSLEVARLTDAWNQTDLEEKLEWTRVEFTEFASYTLSKFED